MPDLVVAAREGLFCTPGNFYIDPWLPVERAVITHAHADHAYPGHVRYLAAAPGAGVLQSRLGDIALETLPYGKKISHNGVTISLHPAGNVLGSAQVRLEYQGEVWVVSGDYKLDPDSTCDFSNLSPAIRSLPNRPLVCRSTVRIRKIYFYDVSHWWQRNAKRDALAYCSATPLARRSASSAVWIAASAQSSATGRSRRWEEQVYREERRDATVLAERKRRK